MKQLGFLLLSVIIQVHTAFAQEGESDALADFHARSIEAGFLCGQLLPSGVSGLTELMPLCGPRVGIKTGEKSYIEGSFLSGAGNAQRYIQGALAFRIDEGFDDLVASMYIAPTLNHITVPLRDSTGATTGESTIIRFGAYLGGAVWAQIRDDLHFRADLTYIAFPGSSLFINISLVLRFGTGGGGGGPGG